MVEIKPGSIMPSGAESFSSGRLEHVPKVGSGELTDGRGVLVPRHAIEVSNPGKTTPMIVQASAGGGDEPKQGGIDEPQRRPGQAEEGFVTKGGRLTHTIISPLLSDETSPGVYAALGKESAVDLSKRLSGQPLEEPPPDYLAILKTFIGGGQGSLSPGEVILAERALSLMEPTRREALQFGDRSPEFMSRARNQFRNIAAGLDDRTLDLKEFARGHPKSRSVLTLLTSLADDPIPDRARMHTLRGYAIDSLQNRTDLVNPAQVIILVDLYGLRDGRVKTTAEVATRQRLSRNAVKNIERVALGLQNRNYHPERPKGSGVID